MLIEVIYPALSRCSLFLDMNVIGLDLPEIKPLMNNRRPKAQYIHSSWTTQDDADVIPTVVSCVTLF